MPRIHFLNTRPEHVRKRLADIEAEERFRARVYWRTIALLASITVLGLVLIALGLHSSSPRWGPVLFWLGVLGADIGFGVTIAWAYLQMEG